MSMKYDFDIHWMVPREVFSKAHAAACEEECGLKPEARGNYVALFRSAETAAALMGTEDAVRRFFSASGFAFNVYDSGAPDGRYPSEDEPAHVDVIERLTENLGSFDPDAHELNGFDFSAFLDYLAIAEPWDAPEPAPRRRPGLRLPRLPLMAAAVVVAAIGLSAALWQSGGGMLSGQLDPGVLHAGAGGSK